MGRWYRGKVTGHDPAKRQHEVVYSDGDVQWLDLEHEAVMWLDVPGLHRREDLAQLQGLQCGPDALAPSAKAASSSSL